MCFEHIHKKNHMVDYLVRQGVIGEDDIIANL